LVPDRKEKTMSEQTEHSELDDGSNGLNELKLLKQRATMMGIPFSNNIGVEALRAKVQAKMAGPGEEPQEERQETQEQVLNPLDPPGEEILSPTATMASRKLSARDKKHAVRDALQKKYMKLVRLRIQNLDPKKKDLQGEIFTVANEVLGTVSKFVPYGEVTDDGYHVPYCIYRQLESRKFVNITVTKDRRTGKEIVKTSMAKEFSLEVLPQLTRIELSQLATAQAAAGSISANE
jgi:hypothetical protein